LSGRCRNLHRNSERAEGSVQIFPRVNYENPFQAISMPVYAIHGNHDDPSRECGQSSESLAAMDLLAVSNLLNYFGKADKVDDVEVHPILIRKGDTHIALYGLGAVRDERLNRMWNQRRVKFVRPSAEQGRDKYFNIFVLHQNRDYGRGSKNCIHESMIPEWMDLVVWGNEHESKPRLEESLVGTFRIFQPGSTVATSLVEGESANHPKGLGFLEVRSTK
jgi:double-strand break repair protein MRE11